MAPHCLSETEIQMRIVPQQLQRWAAPDENTGYRHLREGADGLRSMLIALEAATRAVEQKHHRFGTGDEELAVRR